MQILWKTVKIIIVNRNGEKIIIPSNKEFPFYLAYLVQIGNIILANQSCREVFIHEIRVKWIALDIG